MKAILSVLLFLACLCPKQANMESYKELVNAMLGDYDKRVKPIKDHTKAIDVNMNLQILDLLEVVPLLWLKSISYLNISANCADIG